MLQKKGIDAAFRWAPGHPGICGTTEADEAGRETSSRDVTLTAPAARSIREAVGMI
jgi:hypothetical protein